MNRPRVFPALALVAGLFLTASSTHAQPPNLLPVQRPKVIQLLKDARAPAALPVVPKSSAAFLTVKVSDVIDHPDVKPVLELLKKNSGAMDGVTELFGVAPHEVERITLFWPTLSARGPDTPVVVVTTREPFNEARVLKALKAAPVFDDRNGRFEGHGHDFDHRPAVKSAPAQSKPALNLGAPPRFDPSEGPGGAAPPKPPLPETKPAEKKLGSESFPISTTTPGDPLYYELRNGPFSLLFLVNEHSLVFIDEGPREQFAMTALFAQLLQKKASGPLAEAIAGAGNHTLAGGVYLPPMFREFDRRIPPELAPYAALTAARVGTITGDLGKAAKVTLTLTFDDAAAAKRAAPVLAEGFAVLSEKAVEHATEMKAGRPAEKALAPLFEATAAGLKKATVKADGTAVVATGEIDATAAAAKAVGEVLGSLTSRKKFVARTNNLRQLGLALHSYHDANGRLPANIYGPKGELLLSWRVHLLPYLEQDALYRQFKLDEPWDGPNNKRLVEQMPKVFEVAGRDAPKGQTFYQAFITPDQAKPRPKGGNPFAGRTWLIEGDKRGQTLLVPDGTSNTIAIVEARTSVTWTKPDDLPFAEKLPPLGEERGDRFMALFLDGSVRALSTRIKPETLRILLDGYDGMVTPNDAFEDERPRGFPRRNGPQPEVTVTQAADTPRADVPDLDSSRMTEQLAVAQAVLQKERAVLELRKAEIDRAQKLFRTGAATAKELQEAGAALDDGMLRVRKIELEVRLLEERLRGAEKTPPKQK